MDIILITRDRPELTEQCIRSMRENAADWSKHRLVVVFDGTEREAGELFRGSELDNRRGVPNFIATGKQLGVGGAKNFGADWIRSNARQTVEPPALLMFSDNDMWYGPGWDAKLELAFTSRTGHAPNGPTQLGGWRHPFHGLGKAIMWVGGTAVAGNDLGPEIKVYEVDAATGNCFVISWSDWLKYGPFDANAIGPGQSEDFALSQRIKAAGGIVATLDPPVAIHCGLVNSSGEPAVGWREMEQQITGQLAALPEAMRNEVLIMRPSFIGSDEVLAVAARWPDISGRRELDGYEHRENAPTKAEMAEMAADQLRAIADRAVEESRQRKGADQLNELPRRYLRDFDAALGPSDPMSVISKLARSRLQAQAKLEEGADQLNQAAVEMGLMEPSKRAPSDAIRRISDTWSLKLNLCSGQRRFDTSKGWLNLDGQHVPPERVPDVVWRASDPIPFEDASVQRIAIVHALEHFGCGEALPMLRECYRVLKPGGSLIAVVPDMKRLAARWLSGEINEYIFNVNCYGAYISDEMDRHRWSLSRESLPALLREAGDWTSITEFDYREIPGSDVPRDWWMLAMEATK